MQHRTTTSDAPRRWSVRIEFALPGENDALHDGLFEALAPYAGNPSTNPNGNLAIRVSVDGKDVVEATRRAIDVGRNALAGLGHPAADVVATEVTTEQEQLRLNDED